MQIINALANVVQRQHRCSYAGTVEVAREGAPKILLYFSATDACTDRGRVAFQLDGKLALELQGDVRTFRDGTCMLLLDPMPAIEVAVALIPVALAIEAAYDGYPTCVAKGMGCVPFGMIAAEGASYGLSVFCTCEVDKTKVDYKSWIEHRWLVPKGGCP